MRPLWALLLFYTLLNEAPGRSPVKIPADLVDDAWQKTVSPEDRANFGQWLGKSVLSMKISDWNFSDAVDRASGALHDSYALPLQDVTSRSLGGYLSPDGTPRQTFDGAVKSNRKEVVVLQVLPGSTVVNFVYGDHPVSALEVLWSKIVTGAMDSPLTAAFSLDGMHPAVVTLAKAAVSTTSPIQRTTSTTTVSQTSPFSSSWSSSSSTVPARNTSPDPAEDGQSSNLSGRDLLILIVACSVGGAFLIGGIVLFLVVWCCCWKRTTHTKVAGSSRKMTTDSSQVEGGESATCFLSDNNVMMNAEEYSTGQTEVPTSPGSQTTTTQEWRQQQQRQPKNSTKKSQTRDNFQGGRLQFPFDVASAAAASAEADGTNYPYIEYYTQHTSTKPRNTLPSREQRAQQQVEQNVLFGHHHFNRPTPVQSRTEQLAPPPSLPPVTKRGRNASVVVALAAQTDARTRPRRKVSAPAGQGGAGGIIIHAPFLDDNRPDLPKDLTEVIFETPKSPKRQGGSFSGATPSTPSSFGRNRVRSVEKRGTGEASGRPTARRRSAFSATPKRSVSTLQIGRI